MEKVQKFFDESLYNTSYIGPFSEFIERMNGIIQSFNSLNLREIETKEEVRELYKNPKSFLYLRMTGGILPKLNGVNLDFNKAYDISIIPPEIATMVSQIEALKNDKNIVKDIFNISIENGEITLNQEYLNKGKLACTIYAETEKELAYFEFVEEFKSKIQTVFGNVSPTAVWNDAIAPCISYNSYTNDIKIDYRRLKMYSSNRVSFRK